MHPYTNFWGGFCKKKTKTNSTIYKILFTTHIDKLNLNAILDTLSLLLTEQESQCSKISILRQQATESN